MNDKKISYNNDVKIILNNMLSSNQIKNFILYGPVCSGKTTLINDFINNGKFNSVMKIDNTKKYGSEGLKKILNDFIKTQNIFSITKKIIIIEHVDNINIDIQHSISTIMDKYKRNIIFIFTCNKINKINCRIKSKSLLLRVNKIPKKKTNELKIKKNNEKNILKNILTNKINIDEKLNQIIIIMNDNDINFTKLIDMVCDLMIDMKMYNKIKTLKKIEKNISSDYNFKLQLYTLIILFM